MDVVLRPVVAEDLPLLAVGEAPYDDFGPRVPRTEPYSPELREFGGMAVSDAKRLRALEEENRRLKQLLAETMLDNQALKGLLAKNW